MAARIRPRVLRPPSLTWFGVIGLARKALPSLVIRPIFACRVLLPISALVHGSSSVAPLRVSLEPCTNAAPASQSLTTTIGPRSESRRLATPGSHGELPLKRVGQGPQEAFGLSERKVKDQVGRMLLKSFSFRYPCRAGGGA